jgi:predicted DNA-binding transcriptional regulator AlpA
MTSTPVVELREAFARHAEATGRRWKGDVYPISGEDGTIRIVRVDLSCDEASTLAALIRTVASVYLDTAAVAQYIHVSQSTVRTWLARNLPKQNPFPRPEQILGRNRWPQATIDAWQARQETRIEKQLGR